MSNNYIIFNNKLIFLDAISYLEEDRIHIKKDSAGKKIPPNTWAIVIHLREGGAITTWYPDEEHCHKDYKELLESFVKPTKSSDVFKTLFGGE